MIIIINSLRLSDAYMCHQPTPSLIQMIACRLFGARPLSKPMLYYCQLDHWGQSSVEKYSKFKLVSQDDAFEKVV